MVSFTSCSSQLYNIFPTILEYFPGSHKKIFKNTEELKRFISRRVKRHQETTKPSQPQDFIDAFLVKMEQVGACHLPPWLSCLQ